MADTNDDDHGESSEDDCCVCGRQWTELDTGWPLCDTAGCSNVVCAECASSLDLLVSDLFFCPPCSGSSDASAAAAAGGALASAVAACSDLERLPLSRTALRRVLANLVKSSDEAKFRRLRLANPAVKKYIDLEPVRRILDAVGFVEREDDTKVLDAEDKQTSPTPRERALVLEGEIDKSMLTMLVRIIDSLSPDSVSPEEIPPDRTTLSGSKRNEDDACKRSSSTSPVDKQQKKRKE